VQVPTAWQRPQLGVAGHRTREVAGLGELHRPSSTCKLLAESQQDTARVSVTSRRPHSVLHMACGQGAVFQVNSGALPQHSSCEKPTMFLAPSFNTVEELHVKKEHLEQHSAAHLSAGAPAGSGAYSSLAYAAEPGRGYLGWAQEALASGICGASSW